MGDENETANADDSEYRRGVVLGLTMAEVTILLLFCLLLASLAVLSRASNQIAELKKQHQPQTLTVSASTAKVLEAEYGAIRSHTDIDEDFDKLFAAKREDDQIRAVLASAGLSSNPKHDVPQAIQDIVKVSVAGRTLASEMKMSSATPEDTIKAINMARQIVKPVADAGALPNSDAATDPSSERTSLARVLCADQGSDEKRYAECVKKIIDTSGGKGLEFQSCWWDKTTSPWKTKNIYDVILTDSGFVVRDLDPGTDEYRSQKQNTLPVAGIKIGVEVDETSFLAETLPLRLWSDQNKCRFYVRVIDQTGPSSKEIYKARLSALEDRFYKNVARKLTLLEGQ
ncbi:MAG TPA: hypothetical protein VMH86_01570 [Rhizomicrobium sp.]|nr:hypothetical protein [Rhizomicrobium sp.]